MMFIDVSMKMLVFDPLTKSIICHHNLLMGKPTMTSPGKWTTGNKTRTGVCPDANTTAQVCMFMFHTVHAAK